MEYLLHHFLSGAAERYLEKTAVQCRARSISYAQLEDRSARLAAALREAGLGRGDRVGIYLEKSIEAVVSMFGILRAGSAYVPLDPQTPPGRAAFIMRDCAMRGVIADSGRLSALEREQLEGVSCRIRVGSGAAGDLEWAETMECDPWREPIPAIDLDPAYLLYTSGSTGQPKGVVISHRAALTFVNWARQTFALGAGDRLSNHAPLHFDLSVFDLHAGLRVGSTVVMIPPEVAVFPIHLADLIEAESLSVWYSVPSALIRLLLYGQTERHTFSHLRTILFAGEVFPTRYLRLLRQRFPQADLYNLYGPTETNVCTFHRLDHLPEDDRQAVPIGRACANTEVLAVDETNRLIQPGQTGELWVRGSSLMTGYWGLPEATREAFCPHPFAPDWSGERVYRTGDRVTVDAEGNYYFLGRRDEMVKSRGYRIELGEIEAILHRLVEVQEAAVVAVPHPEIGHELKAAVVPSPGHRLDSARLESLCAELLPRYMIPTRFEIRPFLPRTATGKVDKQQILREG